MQKGTPLSISDSRPPLLDRRVTGVVLLVIILLTVIDIGVDLIQGVEPIHISIEACLIPLAGFGLWRVWRQIGHLGQENQTLSADLEKVRASAQKWKEEASRHVQGLSDAIDAQLTRWGLSQAEKEIALLMLKGLSHKEIAEARKTSERTVRQQALAVYDKSGLSGRAQLAAFFLEDLLSPQ